MRLDVVASGMVTPLGYSAPASCAAMRVGFAGFYKARFEFDGDFIRIAEVPMEDTGMTLSIWDKHAWMAIESISECLSAVPSRAPRDTAIALCLAESERSGRLNGLDERLLTLVCARVGEPARLAARKVFQGGPLGGVEALLWAEQALESEASYCIVAGVDSYLTGPMLTALHAAGRLQTERNSDGFIPGEAGAAVLLSRPGEASDSIECRGIGWGMERAVRGSGLPLRADGLSQAYRAAFKAAGFGFPGVDYRIADVGGDHYAFKEAALALQRTMRVRKESFELWHPTDCVGRVGAASVPLVLGIALAASRKYYAPGPGALCHFADEGGRRAAVVLRERDGRQPPTQLA